MAGSSILFVTTDMTLVAALRPLAAEMGAELCVAGSLRETGKALARQSFDALLVELDSGGSEVGRRLSDGLEFPGHPPAIVISKRGSIPDAVRAIRAGACEYLAGVPKDAGWLEKALHKARRSAVPGTQPGGADGDGKWPMDGFISVDDRVVAACETLGWLAETNATVLIEGESGTGKSFLARALHERSARRFGPFVEINCSVLDDPEIERELFGGADGTVDSAGQASPAKLRLADGGTLLLDEVAGVSLSLLSKAVAAAESGRAEGDGAGTIRSDVRLVMTSNGSTEHGAQCMFLQDSARNGRGFAAVKLPPLRERVADIPLLARHFLRAFRAKHRSTVKGISPEARARLMHHGWPGNVRELMNAIEHGVILSREETIAVESLPRSVRDSGTANQQHRGHPGQLSLRAALREPERQYILQALRESEWNKEHAASKLRISRSTLYKKIKEHGLTLQWASE